MSKGGWREFDNSRASLEPQASSLTQPKDKRQVRIHKTRSGKGGKLVTVINGLEASESEAKKLLKGLKLFCGTGGTIKAQSLELQGDHIERAITFLTSQGFRPKKSGG